MMEMVERVARALALAEDADDEIWEVFIPDARAAIGAMREPTEAMVKAGDACDEMWGEFTATPKHAADCEVHWEAMVDAALTDAAAPAED